VSNDAQPPDDNIALIGGIVGGFVALFLVGGLIAFFVVRSRRDDKSSAIALPPSTTATSNYDRIPTKPNYDDVDAVRAAES
jgi:hypothetical protein